MLTDAQIRASLVIIHRAMVENPAALERIAGEVDGSDGDLTRAKFDQVGTHGTIGGAMRKDMAEQIAKRVHESLEAERPPDYAALAAQIIKAYKGA